jgi:EH_Signature domain
MDDFDSLFQRLEHVSGQAIGDLRVEECQLMGLPDEVARILGRTSAHHPARIQDKERIWSAVSELRDGATEFSRTTLRYAAYGSCSVFTEHAYCLVGDSPALDRFLNACEHEGRADPRWFRKFYGALLDAYFSAERDADWFKSLRAEAGHRQVRKFLQRHMATVIELEPRTNWADALARQSTLLGDNPGVEFASEWINGNDQALKSVMEQLRLGGTSWLATDTVRAALLLTTQFGDTEFRARIQQFLTAAGHARFGTIRDEIYADLLTRYSKCRDTSAHPALRDAVIAAWRAPWLTKNQAAWGRVSPEARKMVEGWLKLELIHQFFDVLSENPQQDRRRFEFWRQYHERMDSIYFALGSKEYRSKDADMVRLKVALDGRLLFLSDTVASNNAFIMTIGDRVYVEFSQHGNAALPFLPSSLRIADSQTTLSHQMLRDGLADTRLVHRGAWESRFHDYINGRRDPASPSWQAASSSRAAPHIDHIIGYARANGIGVDDKRNQGGNLWLLADQANSALNERFTAWGFAYKSGRGWWRAD